MRGFFFFFSPSLFIGTSLSCEYGYAFFSSLSVQQHWAVGFVWVAMRVFSFFLFPFSFYLYIFFFFLTVLQHWAVSAIFGLSLYLYSNIQLWVQLLKKKLYSNTELWVQLLKNKSVQQHWAVNTLMCVFFSCCFFFLFCIRAATLNRKHSCELFSLSVVSLNREYSYAVFSTCSATASREYSYAFFFSLAFQQRWTVKCIEP